MSWTRAYRLALHLLPAPLRRNHGSAMEALFAREIGRARARGRLHGALAGVAGVWDVVRRGAYEQVRPARDAAGERSDHPCQIGSSMAAHGPQAAGANPGGPLMPQPTTRQLLRRHAASFAVAFVALTALLLANYAMRRLPDLSGHAASAGAVAELVLLAAPFIAALTIPMAVFVAVLYEFTRLGADGTLGAARRERDGVRRLVVPVLGAAAGVALLAFVVTAEIVPRTNERLSATLSGHAASENDREIPIRELGYAGYKSDREMTIRELRDAAQAVRPVTGSTASERDAAAEIAGYEIEVQKKFALPAACVVMAFAGVAFALRAPRGGAGLVIGASFAVFGMYYMLLMTGEDLANRLLVSPFVAMWGANALLLAAASLAVWRRRAPGAPGGSGAVAISR
jgi:lipopolysaccharide export LptBFGC system permease protein LptF